MLYRVQSVWGVIVFVEAAFHLSAQLVLSIAGQRFGGQRIPYSIQQLLHELWVHFGLAKIHGVRKYLYSMTFRYEHSLFQKLKLVWLSLEWVKGTYRTCFICALLLGGDLNSLLIACPQNHRQGKGNGAKYCEERIHFLFLSVSVFRQDTTGCLSPCQQWLDNSAASLDTVTSEKLEHLTITLYYNQCVIP